MGKTGEREGAYLAAQERICFEITSGDSGVSVDGSISTLRMTSSSSSSERESSWSFWSVSSPTMFAILQFKAAFKTRLDFQKMWHREALR
jgi:hypothetical protein